MAAIRRLLADAINATNSRATNRTSQGTISEDNSEDDFEDIIQRTRASFRPRTEVPHGRGRRKGSFKRRCFLLKRANTEFYPIRGECEMLQDMGFGFSKTIPKFQMKWKIGDIETYIASLYPETPLELVGFQMAKMDRKKKLIRLRDIENVENMKDMLGQSQLVIIPNRDLPNPVAVTSNPHHGAATASTSSTEQPTQSIQQAVQQRRSTQLQPPTSPITPIHHEIEEAVSNEVDFDDTFMDTQLYEQDETIDLTEDSGPVQLFPSIDEGAEILLFEVSRNNVFNYMLEAYQDESILFKKLKVIFTDEKGEDFGGLTKELFTIFWEACYSQFFSGEDVVIPHLSLHDRRTNMDKFRNIGRIFIHTLTLTNTLPNKLAKSLLLRLGNLEYNVPPEVIKEDFLHFLTKPERIILKKAESDFKSLTKLERSLLEDLFQTYELFEIPRENIIADQILTIAENVIMTKPFEFIRLMKNGIPLLFERFWFTLDPKKLNAILQKQAPTRNKLINCLKLSDENLTQQQSSIFYYLKTFINTLDLTELSQFLYFVTGSSHMPLNITVMFSNVSGIARTPVAHTCSNLLELPVSYTSYQDFSKEFKAVLGSEFSYEYTQI